MNPRRRVRTSDFATLLLIVGLPLLGAALAGRDLDGFFRFPPPLEIPSEYPRFSWLAVGSVLTLPALIIGSWFVSPRRLTMPPAPEPQPPDKSDRARFPWWGWVALGWTLGWWVIAWTRWPEIELLRRTTFFPLWLGFIVAVNAHNQHQTGTCLMRRAPRRWLALFGASALFWWLFEWLNRAVHNWHYLGVSDYGPVAYALHASLCFSTVLPAVAAVAEALDSHSTWRHRVATGPRWRWLAQPGIALALFAAGATALLFTGAWPQHFYFALWIAPLAMFLGKDVLLHPRSLAHEIARGEWQRAATWMTAALVCGFFWELWNWRSLPKWIYAVPGVERWHVFEMPLLGYLGYLPFGLECLLVVERLGGLRTRAGHPEDPHTQT